MEWTTFLKPFPQNPLWLNIPPYLNKYLDLIAFEENVGFEKIDRFFYDIGISIWNQKDIDNNRISRSIPHKFVANKTYTTNSKIKIAQNHSIAVIKKIRKIKFLANVRVGKVVCGTSGRSWAFELRVDGKQRHLAQGIRRR